MVNVKVGGRELALAFTVDAMDELEKRLGEPIDLTTLQQAIVSKLADRRVLLAVACILAQQGEYLAGRDPDFDETWLRRHAKPGQQISLHASVVQAIAEGLSMETGETDENAEVDVVLEELKKKQARAGSATGR